MRGRWPGRALLAVAAAALVSSVLGGCASLESASSSASSSRAAGTRPDRAGDPLQSINRRVFAFNRAVDEATFKPIARAYDGSAPTVVRRGVSNVLGNLREPYAVANDLLQGRPCQAAGSATRFLVNSTIGLAGLVDVAKSKLALDHHDNDIGLTLAAWKVPAGPYLVLPVLGPSNVRDTAGFAAEWFLDPVDIGFSAAGVGTLSYVRSGLELLDKRADVLSDTDHLDATALDPYATYRSAARQSRLEDARLPRCQVAGIRTAPAAKR